MEVSILLPLHVIVPMGAVCPFPFDHLVLRNSSFPDADDVIKAVSKDKTVPNMRIVLSSLPASVKELVGLFFGLRIAAVLL